MIGVYFATMNLPIRNIAIIAHVDHGKTTLIDKLLAVSGSLDARKEATTCVMDSNELEKERGITILAKNTAINWKGHRINIVDTPGHADFGGEVERILSMVDSVLLLVDAVEGPMPQTRFVTQKAFAQGLSPIVVVNKLDRPQSRPDWVIDQVFDLFDNLGASDQQLDFPIVYASALAGFATLDPAVPSDSMQPLLDLIIEQVPAPQVSIDGPLQMQISALDYSSYTGAIGIGRVTRGELRTSMPVAVIDRAGATRKGRILQILGYNGLDRVVVDSAQAGDIVAITGIEQLRISDTICDPNTIDALPPLTVDEPTVSMTFHVNKSPFAGLDGKYLTSRQIHERLMQELIHNVALRVHPGEDPDQFIVSGRGELHLSILIETMRREGYELAVSRPEVVVRENAQGELEEPYELLILDIPLNYQGAVIDALNQRRGQLKNMLPDNQGWVRLEYLIPSRGLFGFNTSFLTVTSGTGVMSRTFDHYGPRVTIPLAGRVNGVMIANASGKSVAYALWNLQERGRMLVVPQTDVYEGMVVGIHSRDNDLVVNVSKEKQLTNIRAAGSDENINLTPAIQFTLEQALAFINEDELVEVTPSHLRIRKKFLKEHERKRYVNSKANS